MNNCVFFYDCISTSKANTSIILGFFVLKKTLFKKHPLYEENKNKMNNCVTLNNYPTYEL